MSSKQLIFLFTILFWNTISGISQINVSPISGCAPLINVSFTTSNSGYTNIYWDFGDGAGSVNQTANHTYANPGTYIVVFTAELSGNPITETTNIQVFESPDAGFEILSQNTGCAPYIVNFIDTSTTSGFSSIVQRLWTFGDGSTQTTSNTSVSHTYINTGIYDISLEVTNNNGCVDFVLLDSFIWVSAEPDVSIFTDFYSITNCDSPMAIVFNAIATSASLITDSLFYSWDFGNSITSNFINNQIEFNPGNYMVSLNVSDEIGCNSTAYFPLNVISPTANFNLLNSYDYTICDTAIFNNLTNISNAFWQYGDGSSGYSPEHYYPNPGIYDVTLTLTQGSCVIDTTIPITVEDIEALFFVDTNYSCNSPFPVQFIDSSYNAVEWYYFFGDGEASSAQNPLHYYINNFTGLYDMAFPVGFHPYQIATSSHGCHDTYYYPDTIILDVPTAWFMPNVVTGTAPITINFSDSSYSTANIISWHWDFGDGTDTLVFVDTVSHTYTQGGIYDVVLTIINDMGCGDVSYPITIEIDGGTGGTGGGGGGGTGVGGT